MGMTEQSGHNAAVAVLLSDLLSESDLGLRGVWLPAGAEARPVRWAATTELPDPVPFLRGGELVMTTAMTERTEAQWLDLATRLTEVPVAAVCLGVGLVHDAPPPGLVRAAEATGLALVTSPVEVPFIQISRWLADALYAESYAAIETGARVQDRLLAVLMSRQGTTGLLTELRRQLGLRAVLLSSPTGGALDRSPRDCAWQPTPDAAAEEVQVEDVPVAVLYADPAPELPGALRFAATILGLEVARAQASLTGSRELLGQVLEDVIHRIISDHDARRRLGRLGVDAAAGHTVVVAVISGAGDRLRRVPWEIRSALRREGDPLPTALLGSEVVVLVPDAPEETDAAQVAERLRHQLLLAGYDAAVGHSSTRTGVTGLRVGYHEARQSVRSDGVGIAASLTLSGLLLGNLDLPLAELATEVLGPLLRHDRDSGADLVNTVRAFLEHDASVSRTAATLVLHRNTLRQRLEVAGRLLGRDLARLEDRFEISLALRALSLGGQELPRDTED